MLAIECADRDAVVVDEDLVLTVVRAEEDGVELQLESLPGEELIVDTARQQESTPALLIRRPAFGRN